MRRKCPWCKSTNIVVLSCGCVLCKNTDCLRITPTNINVPKSRKSKKVKGGKK